MRRIAFRFGNIFINLFLLYSNISKSRKSWQFLLFSSSGEALSAEWRRSFVCFPRDVNKFLASQRERQGSRKSADRCRSRQIAAQTSAGRGGGFAGNINKPEIYGRSRRELRKIHLIAAHHALHRSPSTSPKPNSTRRRKLLRVHKRLKRS
jgi:hypothetical protein